MVRAAWGNLKKCRGVVHGIKIFVKLKGRCTEEWRAYGADPWATTTKHGHDSK